MASKKQLEEAKYIHRGDAGKYIEGLGQCSFSPCDHSKIVIDDKTGEEYRYCMKLQMPVDSYDSCKYHSEERWIGLVGQMSNLLQEENNIKSTFEKKSNKKSHKVFFIFVIIICVLIYFWLN